MPVPQGVAPSLSAQRRIVQPLPVFDGRDLAMLAGGAAQPVLAAVAETLQWRVGESARCAFYDDAPYVPPEQPSRF